MPGRDRRQPARAAATIAAVVALVACAKTTPRTAVHDLNWACGASRCTASFRLVNEGADAERLVVLVRAYSGDRVASRVIAGEHRERAVLQPGQSRRYAVVVELQRPASAVRVVVARAES